jgi:hypothetical protein
MDARSIIPFTVDRKRRGRPSALVMSELWPLDVRARLDKAPLGPLRPFKCLLLMPFEGRFNKVSEVIEAEVKNVAELIPLSQVGVADSGRMMRRV